MAVTVVQVQLLWQSYSIKYTDLKDTEIGELMSATASR